MTPSPTMAHHGLPDLILGFDPGLSGAVALLDTRTLQGPLAPSSHPLTAVYDLPTRRSTKKSPLRIDGQALANLIRTIANTSRYQVHAVVELVGSLPHQAGAFNFGVSAGILHGILDTLDIPYTLIPPSQWKPAMGLQRRTPDETQASTKTRARELATKLFPHLYQSFSRVKDDGRAEALLLAYYYNMGR